MHKKGGEELETQIVIRLPNDNNDDADGGEDHGDDDRQDRQDERGRDERRDDDDAAFRRRCAACMQDARCSRSSSVHMQDARRALFFSDSA